MTQKEFTAKVDADYNDRRKQANAEWMETEEYKNNKEHKKEFYNGKYMTTQFDIDSETDRAFAMRFVYAARPVKENIAKKYNLRSYAELS